MRFTFSASHLQAEREARMERDARRAAGLPGVEPGADDEDEDSDSEEILDLVPEVPAALNGCYI